MGNKLFAERLGNELDSMDIPERLEDRVDAFSKLLKIPRFKAEALITGVILPDGALLIIMAKELEVNASWLIGKSNDKH